MVCSIFFIVLFFKFKNFLFFFFWLQLCAEMINIGEEGLEVYLSFWVISAICCLNDNNNNSICTYNSGYINAVLGFELYFRIVYRWQWWHSSMYFLPGLPDVQQPKFARLKILKIIKKFFALKLVHQNFCLLFCHFKNFSSFFFFLNLTFNF